MKRIDCYRLAAAALLVPATIASLAAAALASPNPNSAIINARIFNDYPGSVLTTVNAYPGALSIQDDDTNPCCFANLHNWRFSDDGGANPSIFMNGDVYRFGADLMIDGTSNGEAGLQIAPWWSPDVDGRFNVRLPDGEIACFGGVLPFYVFTNVYGIRYERGQVIHLEINYLPRSNTQADPALIEYKLTYQGQFYTSGLLPMTNCNAAEQPIYGCYGTLNFARAGGYIQCFNGAHAGPVRATWTNIFYSADPKPTASVSSTWGRMKVMYR